MENSPQPGIVQAAPSPTDWTWEEMVAEFQALGGIADNVCLRRGPAGRGLFAVDPSRPAHIQVPQNLLFDSDNIAFDNGVLRVKERDPARRREEDFFEAFENVFSWGGGGRTDCEATLRMFNDIPDDIIKLLIKDFGLSENIRSHGMDAVQNKFLKSRRIRLKDGRQVLMPLLELANHDVGGEVFQFNSGISIRGTFADEILVRYNITDPFGIFFTWGFPGNASHAFSLPIRIRLGSHQIQIRRNINQKKIRGKISVPQLTEQNGKIDLSFLLIGNAKNPRVVKGIFFRVLQDIHLPNVEEVLDRIHTANIRQFVRLLTALENHEGPSISALRKMALFQVEAISHCIGAKKL